MNRKKYFCYCLCLAVTSFWLGGCAYTLSPIQGFLYTNVEKPVTYKSSKENKSYEVLGHVEARSTATSVLGIVATGDAGAKEVVAQAYSQIPGTEGLVDVCIDQNFTSFLGLHATATTVLRAKAVKWLDSPQAISATTSYSQDVVNYDIPTSTSQTGPIFDFEKIRPFLSQGTPMHNINLSLGNLAGEPGGVGFRFGYKFRRTGFPFTFNPEISFGKVKREETEGYNVSVWNSETRRYDSVRREYTLTNYVNVIPVALNVTANADYLENQMTFLPPQVKPYAQAGLVYYMWKPSAEFEGYGYDGNFVKDSDEGDWDFFEVGLNFGLGVEYYLKPNLAINAGFNRYIVFDKDFDFWDYQVGVVFSLNN